MPESTSNGAVACFCPFQDEDVMRRVQKHWTDTDELRNVQSDGVRKMGELTATQTTLNSTLTSINESLKDGFELGVKVVRLFGLVVIVFFVALMILALVVVYIAHISIDYKDLHIHHNGDKPESHDTP